VWRPRLWKAADGLGCGRRCSGSSAAGDGVAEIRTHMHVTGRENPARAAERLRLDAISLGQCGAAAARRDATWFLNADCTWSRLRHVVSRDVGVAEEAGQRYGMTSGHL